MTHLCITVDTREPEKLYNRYVKEHPNITFKRERLDEGDYLATCECSDYNILVERKTIADLYQSIMGEKQKNGRSRYSNEVNSLSIRENDLVLFVIIGSISTWIDNSVKLGIPYDASKIYGAIASLMVREQFHIFWCKDEFEARQTIVKFAEAVYAGKYSFPSRRDPAVLMARILKITLPQYIELKTKFGSTVEIIKLKPEDLTFVRGIGISRANFIIDTLKNI